MNEELSALMRRGRPQFLGQRVMTHVGPPPLTPAQVLDPQADINTLIANAVALALKAEKDAQGAKMQKARAAKAAKHPTAKAG